MSRRQPRGQAVEDALLAVLTKAWPTPLLTAEVARLVGDRDWAVHTFCEGAHLPSGARRLVSCEPETDEVWLKRWGKLKVAVPVVHVYRRQHDSQSVGPVLAGMARAGKIRLIQSGNVRRWLAVSGAGGLDVDGLEALWAQE